MNETIPIINISALCVDEPNYTSKEIHFITNAINKACSSYGFFYITGYESIVSSKSISNLESLATTFFNQTQQEKMNISMKQSGLHWKGYFPSGDELTSGSPDAKEGIYFGEEYSLDSPQVLHKLAMHGPNQFPTPKEQWRSAVLHYMNALTILGLRLMRGIALSLNLPSNHFEKIFMQPKPFTPFRIFRYPGNDSRQGVGRHTDYGCLTILKQDDVGGLEVEIEPNTWIKAPPVSNSFVVNIGDMLEIWTSGVYKATPHRVKPGLKKTRMSMPFFFDPSFDAVIDPKELRQDSSVLKLTNAAGTTDVEVQKDVIIKYGEYITHKVAHVFPELFEDSGGKDRLSKL